MSYAYDWVPASKRRCRNAPNQLLSCLMLKTEVLARPLTDANARARWGWARQQHTD